MKYHTNYFYYLAIIGIVLSISACGGSGVNAGTPALPAAGNVIRVPVDYSTIVAGINAASSGDTVFLNNIIADNRLGVLLMRE
jgi:hypothetical protein